MEKKRRQDAWALLLLPSLVWLGLFFFAPLVIILAISFFQRGEFSVVQSHLDFSAYARLFEPANFRAILRSLVIAAITTGICLMVGYPLAYYIARRSVRLRQWLHFLVLLPLWTNSIVLMYAWIILLRHEGILEKVLGFFGWSNAGTVLYTPLAIVIGLSYWYLPFMVYPIYNSIEKFDFTLMEAAHDLGATRFQAFRKILLPLTLPGVIAGTLLVFISSLGTFVVPFMLGGDKALMFGTLIQQRFLSIPQDWPLGAALSVIMLVLISSGIAYYLKITKRLA
jgi:spermidine/putrescine transport system permease protein